MLINPTLKQERTPQPPRTPAPPMLPGEAPEVMTLQEAASYLRLNLRTLYQMARAGELPRRKVRNRWRFSKAALDAWIAEGNKSAEEEGGQA